MTAMMMLMSPVWHVWDRALVPPGRSALSRQEPRDEVTVTAESTARPHSPGQGPPWDPQTGYGEAAPAWGHWGQRWGPVLRSCCHMMSPSCRVLLAPEGSGCSAPSDSVTGRTWGQGGCSPGQQDVPGVGWQDKRVSLGTGACPQGQNAVVGGHPGTGEGPGDRRVSRAGPASGPAPGLTQLVPQHHVKSGAAPASPLPVPSFPPAHPNPMPAKIFRLPPNFLNPAA